MSCKDVETSEPTSSTRTNEKKAVELNHIFVCVRPVYSMSERPTTNASSRPSIANNGSSPLTNWSDPEAPSTSHSPTNYTYPTNYYQHQQAQTRHLLYQHHLHAQQGERYNDNDDGGDKENDEGKDDGHVFAYGPPSPSEHPSQPHQMQYSQHHLKHHHQQQDKSQRQDLYTAQLHNLVKAAGLSTSPSAPPQPPSSVPASPTSPNSHSLHAQDHHHHHNDKDRNRHKHHKHHAHPLETCSSDGYSQAQIPT